MRVELYERIWMWAGAAILVLFVASMLVPAIVEAIHPPSHVETIDPETISSNPEFKNGAVRTDADGRLVVSVLATTFSFAPDRVEVPANRPVTFRVTSGDVIHGFEVVGTNANAMAIPGYVSQFTMTFPTPGEYVIACHEYCGLLHHAMVGTLVVKQP